MYAGNHTLKKYIAKAFDSHFWAVAEKYLTEHMDVFDLEFYRIHCPGEFEIGEVQVDYVWVADSPGMQMLFDVLLVVTLEVHEANYRYDNKQEKSVRLMVRCRGGLEQELKDFEIRCLCKMVYQNFIRRVEFTGWIFGRLWR